MRRTDKSSRSPSSRSEIASSKVTPPRTIPSASERAQRSNGVVFPAKRSGSSSTQLWTCSGTCSSPPGGRQNETAWRGGEAGTPARGGMDRAACAGGVLPRLVAARPPVERLRITPRSAIVAVGLLGLTLFLIRLVAAAQRVL